MNKITVNEEQIKELTGFTKHMYSLIQNYFSFIMLTTGKTSKSTKNARKLNDLMTTVKFDIEDFYLKHFPNGSLDLSCGPKNLDEQLITDFIEKIKTVNKDFDLNEK